VPAATAPAQQLDPPFYKNVGIAVDVIPIPPGTADMTPQIQAELDKNPDQFSMLGNVPFCVSAIKALKTLDFTKPIVVVPQCISAASAPSIPGGYAGIKLVTNSTISPTDPDVKLYLAVMAKYAPSTSPFGLGVTAGGFAAVMAFVRAMSGVSGPLTPASVEAAYASMSPQPLPFGGGITFQCNGKQISITPAVCSTGALEATLDQSGNPVGNYTPLDASALEKL